MKIIPKKLVGVYEFVPDSHDDFRGFLVRIWDDKIFAEAGLKAKWVQESHSHTEKKNTIRGFHIQFPPHSEAKLIRVVKGEIKWIVVDMRKNSPTFGQWDSVVLTDKLKNVLYVEKGFANGSITLSDDVDLVIKADNFFNQELGTGINWKDPDLNIDWGLSNLSNGEKPIILDRDDNYPSFREFKEKYGGILLKENNNNFKIAQEIIRLRLSQMIINEKCKNKEFKIPLHLALGHETIATSVGSIMGDNDQLVLPHRNIHYNLARESSLKPIIEEFLLNEKGLAQSQLGSMNLANKEKGVVYTSSILGNNLAVAAGLALGKKVKRENGMVIVVCGDGAIEEGSFYESLVFLKSNQLPSLIIIENNQWSLATKIEERRCNINLNKFSDSLGIKFEKLSGNDPYQYILKLRELKEYSLSNNLPVCVEVELATLGHWYIETAGYPLPGRFVNYHAGAAPTIELKEWPLIEGSNNDPLFVLKKYFEENVLQEVSNKILLSLQEEIK